MEAGDLKGPWSFSRATMCPRAMYMKYVVKAPREPRPESLLSVDRRRLGSVLHVCADLVTDFVIKNGDYPDAGDIVDAAMGQKDRDGSTNLGVASLVPVIRESVSRYMARFRADVAGDDSVDRGAWIRGNCLYHEKEMCLGPRFSVCDQDFENCPVDGWRGKCDYVEYHEDGRLVVIDYKNRPAMYTDSELMANEQLSLYTKLVMVNNKGVINRVDMGIYYFEFGYTQMLEDVGEDVIDANVARLEARARFVNQLDKPVPEPGFGKCQYCEYLASCDLGKNLVFPDSEALAALNTYEAVKMARRLVVVKELAKALQEGLRAFTAEHGPLDLDDETRVGWSEKAKYVYDKRRALSALKSLIDGGRVKGNLGDMTNLDLIKIKRLCKDEYVDSVLAGARSEVMETKFDIFNPEKRSGVKKPAKKKKAAPSPSEDMEQPRKTRGRVKR